jgi:hypothetical protein
MRQPSVRTRDIVTTYTALRESIARRARKATSRVTHVSRPSGSPDGIAAAGPPQDWIE